MIAPPPPARPTSVLVAIALIINFVGELCQAADATRPPSLSSRFPAGAYGFVETSSLANVIQSARESDLLDGVLQSEDFAELREREWFQDLTSSVKLAEFVLRMNLWEASRKLLGGGFGFAVYPAADGPGGEPELAFLIRPAEPSAWLKRRVWSAPVLRIGLKRIERLAFGETVAAYRTRGDTSGATYFALHNDWIAAASNIELLKKTVRLQGVREIGLGEPSQVISDEPSYQLMDAKIGGGHLGRLFIDSRRVLELSREAGPNLGLPDRPNDPMISLFFGGLTELVEASRYACLSLNVDRTRNQLQLTAGIDACPDEVADRYRIFFSDNPSGGIPPLPVVRGMIGGFTLYRQFGHWYRNRDEPFQQSIIPGIEGFEGNVGDILLGQTDAEGNSVVGDQLTFISAMRDDAGAEPSGAALPGFAFLVALDPESPTRVTPQIEPIFRAVLRELRLGREEEFEWRHGSEVYRGTPIRSALADSGGSPLSPSIARVGDRLILSSSLKLCRDLIDYQNDQGHASKQLDRDLLFHLRTSPLHELLALNRKHYFRQLVRDGRSSRQALDDLTHIENVLTTFSSFEGSSTAGDGMFEMRILGKFR